MRVLFHIVSFYDCHVQVQVRREHGNERCVGDSVFRNVAEVELALSDTKQHHSDVSDNTVVHERCSSI